MNLQLAARAFNSGDFRVAEQLCQQTLAAEPSNPEAMNLMGALAGTAGRHDLAAEWMRKAIQLRPRDPYYRRNYITALLSLDRVEDAAEAVQQSLQLLPGDAHLMTLRGVVLSRQGDYEAAGRALAAAVEINPNFPWRTSTWRKSIDAKRRCQSDRASEESDRVGPQQR